MPLGGDAEAREIEIRGGKLCAEYVGFIRGSVTDNGPIDPGLGFSITYRAGSRGESTVYLYDKGINGIPDGPMSQLVRQEFDRATKEVLYIGRQRPDTLIELVDRYGTGAPERGPEFLCAEFTILEV